METEPSAGAETPGLSTRTLTAIILTTVLLGLTGYLAVESLLGDGQPIGCGDVVAGASEVDSGETSGEGSGGASGVTSGGVDCNAVLNTKWSKLWGLPVSGWAAGLYAVVLGVLLWRRQTGGVVLSAAATAVVGAAAWFVYLQLFEVEAICVYCMVDHGLGVALAALLVWGSAAKQWLPGAAVGLLGTGVLITAQLASDAAVFVNEDGGGTRAGQTLTLLDGRLTLNLDEEMIVGDLSQLNDTSGGGRIMVKIADYNCPHCRHAHEVLHAMDDVAVVLVPMPLNPACNAYVNQLPRPQFLDSCELARLAIAIHRIDPQKLAEYDHWAYGDGWPNTAEAGRAFAETLVDPLQLQMQLNDPAIDAIIQRNTDAWGQARAVELVRGLPVHLVPGGGSTSGGIGDGTSLVQLLDGV
ncbi:MAG: vitamin K epoxide reductase family protein, partial [Planctomycetota bacterium]